MILVAEDEYLLAIMLSDFLQDEGHEVEMLSNGEKALKFLKEQRKPDLLITDYMMPLMNGAELADAVRKEAKLSDLPIILVSGAQAHIGKGRPDLFDIVFEKPYNRREMLKAVNQLLQVGRHG